MSCENVEPTGVGSQSHQNALPPISESSPNLDDDGDGDEDAAEEGVDDEEDEEEDVDFNPFLKETPSPDASSSLSSEIEGLDGDVDNRAKSHNITAGNSSKLAKSKVQSRDIEDSEHCEEETVMQSGSPGLQNTLPRKHNKRKSSSIAEPEREKENWSSKGLDVNDGIVGVLSNAAHSQKPMLNLDDDEDDAICKRTRARYSLASFTLDELEAFLQETDDDDDVKNVDDEEEYRKFLAAVLLGGEADNQSAQETHNVDDEDEENDADFEIELEEALESDYDEGIVEKTQAKPNDRMGRRPETRQNRRQKASAQYERKLLEQTKRPLRPLLPIMPGGPLIPIPSPNQKTWMPEFEANRVSSAGDGLINGFTPYQIGQLHSLIHEHVQLLIQTFSLCVLDPSRQDIASQLQGLILEMLHKRDEVIACRSKPYPDILFSPPYLCSSVPEEVPQVGPARCTSESSTVNAQGVCATQNIQMPTPQNISSRGQDGYVSNSQLCRAWVPSVHCPVLSILDVAPLSLVGRYMDDVYAAVREYRQRHVESSSDARYEKEPLFPLPSFSSESETNSEVLRSSTLSAANTVPSSASQQPSKKTLAATLVERTKKQSVAVVPKEIAKLAQTFFPLFNPALFPHKPPPLAVANRVLFTDAEDELLALGLMEFNSDWKAIQQRFLPCKNGHQIFVRQKNRCSSKAPENPIKAVRRMKTSPLTMLEIQGIQEGLKVFKLDWMSVWRFIVPHRDPSLLPRQWRIALGTQKSYNLDEAKKEKRRLYELKRRKQKADMANMQHASDKEECQAECTGGENCSGDDNMDNGDESYVHEAFLADWRPGTSTSISSECSNIRDKNLPDDLLPQGDHIRQQPNIAVVGRALTGNVHGSPYALNYSQHPYTLSHCASNTLQPSNPVPSMTLNSSKSQIHLRPYRARKSNPHVVKLAPDLPPVNLPPSVRVIPKSALEISQHGAYNKVSASGARGINSQAGNMVLPHPQHQRPATSYSVKVTRDTTNSAKEKVTNSCAESGVGKERCVDERSNDSDLHMHPLLFQNPEDGRLPYYPLNAGTGASSSFSFFSGSQPQLNLTLFYNPQVANHVVDGLNKSLRMKESSSAAYGIEFHPLLQRTDDTNNELQTACVTARHPSVGLEGKSAQLQSPSNDVQTKTIVHCSPVRMGSRPSSPKEKINELDLEIHLSSSSTKENIVVSRQVTAHPTRLIAGLRNPENAIETGDTAGLSSDNPDSNVHASVAPSKEIGRCNIDDTSDHSHPGIVMEQEELSDSDEEVEEHVEFECEEMTDSDGEEGSGSEQIAEVQDKEGPSFLTEKVATDADGDDQQLGVNTPGRSKGKFFVPRQQTPPFLKLGLAHPRKDTSNSWLSLDSCTETPTSHSKPKNEGSTTKKGPAAKNLISNRSSRSSKQKSPTVKKLREHDIDMAERLSLGHLSIRTLRKPRKRASRANTGLNIGMDMESSKNDVKEDV
ncbi:hypothetical protein SLE2022_015710 [Rubroshorea leprosula]